MSGRFLVMISSASVSARRRSYGGQYLNVAVVEIDQAHPEMLGKRMLGEEVRPAMISERAKGVRRIVRQWPGCYVGAGKRSQYAVALTEADALAARLNAGEPT